MPPSRCLALWLWQCPTTRPHSKRLQETSGGDEVCAFCFLTFGDGTKQSDRYFLLRLKSPRCPTAARGFLPHCCSSLCGMAQHRGTAGRRRLSCGRSPSPHLVRGTPRNAVGSRSERERGEKHQRSKVGGSVLGNTLRCVLCAVCTQ